jgi:hypothetical protein
MTFTMTKSHTEYQFEVTDEAPLDHTFNPANGQFQPGFVRVTFYDGELFDVYVQGPLINAKGKLLKKFGGVSWSGEDFKDLTSLDAPPQWVVNLVNGLPQLRTATTTEVSS